MKTIVFTAALALIFPLASAAEIPKAMLGKWHGYSKNIYSIYGDISVGKEALEFEKHGTFRFSELKVSDAYVVLKLDRALRCGQFVALVQRLTRMEFAVYESEEKALVSQGAARKEYCSWGVYAR